MEKLQQSLLLTPMSSEMTDLLFALVPSEIWKSIFYYSAITQMGRYSKFSVKTLLSIELVSTLFRDFVRPLIVEVLERKKLKSNGVLSHFPLLTELDLSKNKFIDNTGIQNLTNITKLNLFANVRITAQGIQQLTNLTSLNIGLNPLIDNETLMKFSNLTELNLDNNSIILDSTFRTLSSITKLNLNGNKKITNYGISHLRNLVELNVNDNSKITKIYLFPNLTRLDLCQNKVLRSGKFNQDHFNNITQLDINSNYQFQGTSLLKFSNLVHLNITKYPCAVDDYLPTTLKTLIFKYFSFISDIGLEKLTSLTYLDMSHYTDDRVTNLSLSKLTNLTYLNMSHSNTAFTDDGISTLTNLRELIYTGIDEISKKSLSLLTNLTSLQSLGTEFSFDIIDSLKLLKMVNGDERKKKF